MGKVAEEVMCGEMVTMYHGLREEDVQRAKMRRDAFNLVEAARQAQDREAKAAGRPSA